MNECPWCGAKAVEVAMHDDMNFDQRAKFMCCGPETHRWRDGDGPAPAEPPSEPLIILVRD